MNYQTKDSGQRQEYSTGMRRDLQDGKPDFSLCLPEGIPYKQQCLTRWAELMERGRQKYGRRNWELASTEEELQRFRASAFRHFMQWYCGETDEDHLAATWFNMQAVEFVKYKQLEQDVIETSSDIKWALDDNTWTEDEHNHKRFTLYCGYEAPEYDKSEYDWSDPGCMEAEIVNHHRDYKWVWKE